MAFDIIHNWKVTFYKGRKAIFQVVVTGTSLAQASAKAEDELIADDMSRTQYSYNKVTIERL